MAKQTKKIFEDIDLMFSAHPITGSLKTVINENAVKQAVKNTVLTNKFERLYNPTNFTNVSGSLFDNITSSSVAFLRQKIRFAIENFEPRAKVLDVTVVVNDTNNVDVNIYFSIEGQLAPQIVTIFLERVR
jgi:predicted component of type VI protein secretion system